jgi:molecular chaperone DnaK
MAAGNKTLARFELGGIAPATRGIPQIEVTFEIDANGIVHVAAKDKGTGKEQSVTITASSNLSEEDIQRAIDEAEKFAEEDNKRKESVDAKNNLDALVFQIEKVLSESGDKLDADDKAKLESAVNKAKETLKGDDVDAYKKEAEELQKVSNEVFTKMYQAAAVNGNPNGGDDNNGDNVVDAEEI